VHHDRRAHPHAIVEWRADGLLDVASVRIPDGSWLTIEPRAGVEAPWGAIDRLWHARSPGLARGAAALTVMTAVAWHAVRTIPTAAEPARLPPGAGTAVLNLLAMLARDQGARDLRYDGPYPTEALFLALLECFHPDRVASDPLSAFAAGEITWTAAPFTPSFEPEAYVQWREGIDKVVWQGRSYYRETWGTVRRRAHLRVLDAGGAARCVLWALGAPIEEHLRIDAGGVPHVLAPTDHDASVRPMSSTVRDGLVAAIVSMSAAPLADAIRETAAELRFTWGPVPRDLAAVDGQQVRASSRLRAVFRERVGTETTAEGTARLALAVLADLAGALGDPLRARAQRRLAEAGPEAQARALERETRDPGAARLITAAAADLVASGGVQDEPDVEGDERRDGDD
jgi:hypothetical protein